jgi:hypothetical protein
LGANADKPHAAYRALVAEELELDSLEAIREATNGGYPLVSDRFKNSAIAALGWRTAREKPGPRQVSTLTPN